MKKTYNKSMKLVNRIDNYLNDNEYKMILKNKQLNIINYDELLDFSLTQVSLRYQKQIFIIEGNNLVISKMVDNEVLITGNITSIRIN